jgi:predicted MPP superfamily phosphohydrolase
MESSVASYKQAVSRRSFLKTALYGAGGLALYAGEFERHWLEVVHKEIAITGLPPGFDGVRLAQLSDIHLDEFTEPFLLREAIEEVNRARP